jgi:hypothetical protein
MEPEKTLQKVAIYGVVQDRHLPLRRILEDAGH